MMCVCVSLSVYMAMPIWPGVLGLRTRQLGNLAVLAGATLALGPAPAFIPPPARLLSLSALRHFTPKNPHFHSTVKIALFTARLPEINLGLSQRHVTDTHPDHLPTNFQIRIQNTQFPTATAPSSPATANPPLPSSSFAITQTALL